MIKLRQTKKIEYSAIDSFLPHEVAVLLKQDDFTECSLMVEPGAIVQEGQVIAQATNSEENIPAIKLHSPVPGIVESVEPVQLPDGTETDAVKIKFKGKFSFRGKEKKSFDWQFKLPSEILKTIAEAGIVNTFSINKTESLAKQISSLKPEASKILVVRLFDEDPYRCTDFFISKNYFEKIQQGAAILCRAICAEGIIFTYDKKYGIPENGGDASEIFKELPVKYIPADCSKYPAGFPYVMLDNIHKQLPKDDFFEKVNIHDLFVDSLTLIHLYEAVVEQIPVINQYVYVYGDCMKVSAVFRLPIGTAINFIIDECGGFLKQPSNIVINGQLTGWKINENTNPVTKNIKSIGFLSYKPFPNITPKECVHCGKCRQVCPVGLAPDILYNQILVKNKDIDSCFLQASTLCSNCTLCNSVCSSRLPLSQVIELIREYHDGKFTEK